MITPEDASALMRIREVARMVKADAERDAMSLDGKPFDGRTVAAQFGQTLAAVCALADAIERLTNIVTRSMQ